MLSIARELRRRGNRVVMYSRPENEELVKSEGLEFIDLKKNPDSDRRLPRWAVKNWIGRGIDQWFRRRQLITNTLPFLYGQIERYGEDSPTVMLGGPNSYGGRIAQDVLGTGFVSVFVSAGHLRSAYDAPGTPLPQGDSAWHRFLRKSFWTAIDTYVDLLLKPTVNRFRKEKGLRGVRGHLMDWARSPQLVIGLFPDWFALPQPDWPAQVRPVGFPLFDERESATMPQQLLAFLDAGQPPVIFTRGSHSKRSKDFFYTSVEVCRQTGLRGVLLSPSAEAVPQDLPDNVLRVPFAPLSLVLPKAAALVHHGGVGTTGLAFEGGVPQLCIPAVEDQFDNAHRVERLGVGKVMAAKDYQPEQIVAALSDLIGNEEVSARCRELAEKTRGQKPVEEACDLIEASARAVFR
jgi:UDP:flavonoid glycosyltransferase YjiC (YdhE family)